MPRTSGNESSSSPIWPTPAASLHQDGETPETWLERREILKATKQNGNGCGTPLTMAVQLWPTPNVPNGGRVMADADVEAKGATDRGKRQVPLGSVASLWSTPRASLNENRQTRPTPSQLAGNHGMNLSTEATLWATPATRDHRSGLASDATLERNARPLNEQVESIWEAWEPSEDEPSHLVLVPMRGTRSSPKRLISRPQLNAAFVCWLMNLPWWWTNPAWTNSGPEEMASYLSVQRRHLSILLGDRG